MVDTPRRKSAWSGRRRLIPIAAAAALAVTLVAPLWRTRMVAPQYRGDEALKVDVYAGRVVGDLAEIQTLNQYIGVHLPLDTPELRATPWVLGALLLLAVLWALVPPTWYRPAAAVLLTGMVLAAALATFALEKRLYEIGHDRDRGVFARVDDFTPPIIGSRKIANFVVSTMPQVGAWAFVAAAGLAGWGAFSRSGVRGRTMETAASTRDSAKTSPMGIAEARAPAAGPGEKPT
ncbi:MAG: hypothetical protein ACE5IK_12045 [Acidobacteriota bacterium]